MNESHPNRATNILRTAAGLVLCSTLLSGCSKKPVNPEEQNAPPLVQVSPAAQAPVSSAEKDREVTTWAMQLQEINVTNLVAQKLDLVVLEPFPDGESHAGLSGADLARLHAVGTKVLAYLSIGEAEDYRGYWQASWKTSPPSWLDAENKDWPGNYKVKYWDPQWQELMKKALLARVDAGYDGVYLDIVDAYEYYEHSRPQARQEMIDFVVSLAKLGRKKNAAFKLYPQNAEELTEDPRYLNSIDGLGREELYYGYEGKDNQATPSESTQFMDGHLKRIRQAGKTVLTIEYTDLPQQRQKAIREASQAGYVTFFAPRKLDSLPPQDS